MAAASFLASFLLSLVCLFGSHSEVSLETWRPFSGELTELQSKISSPGLLRAYLTTFGPHVRGLSQVALDGVDAELPNRVLRDANVVSLPMQLNTRAIFRDSETRYADRLASGHQPEGVRATRVGPFAYHQDAPTPA